MAALDYLAGFGNEHATEAVGGALPQGQNSPQRVAFGLYAEQVSGSAFTAPRADNLRSWQYRVRPSAEHSPFRPHGSGQLRTAPSREVPASPDRLRWDPLPMPLAPVDFVEGIITVATNGDAALQRGVHHLLEARPVIRCGGEFDEPLVVGKSFRGCELRRHGELDPVRAAVGDGRSGPEPRRGCGPGCGAT